MKRAAWWELPEGADGTPSLGEPIHVCDDEESFGLGDVIASRKDDSAQVGARHMDWHEFMSRLDGRHQYIVKATAEGASHSASRD